MRRPRLSATPAVAAAISAFSALAMFAAPASGAILDGYTPGLGLSLFDNHLVIGGYLALNLNALDQQRDSLKLEDLSLFVTWQPTDHLKFFSEFEVEDSFMIEDDGLHAGHDVERLERLYAEWEPNDTFRLRVGKMLTPIGIWNVIHAAPLVWTVSRPLATENFFDTAVTGATLDVTLLRGNVGLVATMFGQATEHLDEPEGPKCSKHAGGGRLELSTERGPRFGVSYVRFDNENTGYWESTFSGDFFWETSRFELSGEASINDPSSGPTTTGLYTQFVYLPRWKLRLYPVIRVEYVDLGTIQRTPVVFGLAWKPTLNTIVKAEGIVGGDDTDLGGEGMRASLAVLF